MATTSAAGSKYGLQNSQRSNGAGDRNGNAPRLPAIPSFHTSIRAGGSVLRNGR